MVRAATTKVTNLGFFSKVTHPRVTHLAKTNKKTKVTHLTNTFILSHYQYIVCSNLFVSSHHISIVLQLFLCPSVPVIGGTHSHYFSIFEAQSTLTITSYLLLPLLYVSSAPSSQPSSGDALLGATNGVHRYYLPTRQLLKGGTGSGSSTFS